MRTFKHFLEYDRLQATIRDWGQNNREIIGILIIGSRAKPNPLTDRLSDLDLIVFTDDSSKFIEDSSWIAKIDKPWLSILSQTERGDPEWVVIFYGGLKADFVFSEAAADSNVDQLVQETVYRFVLDQGYTILYEKNSSKPYPRYYEPADANQSSTVTAISPKGSIDEVLYYGYQVTRYAARNDLWRASQSFAELRNRLLILIEWQTQKTGGANLLIQYEGRNILQWVDPIIKPDLEKLFPGFSQPQLLQGVEDSLKVLEYLASTISEGNEETLPYSEQRELINFIRSIGLEFSGGLPT